MHDRRNHKVNIHQSGLFFNLFHNFFSGLLSAGCAKCFSVGPARRQGNFRAGAFRLYPEKTTLSANVQLIAPDGTPDITVHMHYAVKYCRNNPGWSWRYIDG